MLRLFAKHFIYYDLIPDWSVRLYKTLTNMLQDMLIRFSYIDIHTYIYLIQVEYRGNIK